MSIKIIKPGVLTTLQDAGRYGHRGIGIGPGGAMDHFAISVSNYLTGNDETAAVMEINFPGPEIRFQKNACICLTGADFTATINETAVPVWTALFVKRDSILKFKQPQQGAKLYLAVHGGWKAEKWLNSFSTNLRAAAGGYFGRALLKDDVIECIEKDFLLTENKIPRWGLSKNERNKIYRPENTIRVIRNIEWDLLSAASRKIFETITFSISNQSDRMGYRLNGMPISLNKPSEIISSAVDSGTIQLLPDGNLIVLMADHQTTGGYPRIASVIKADLPKLAQLNCGQKCEFKIVTLKEAEDALISMKEMLADIKNACHHNFKKHFQL